MPIYEYRCDHCGSSDELNVPMTGMTPTILCKGCGRDAHRVYSPPTIRFIGPGFHNTDYRKGKKREDKEQPTPQETKAKADANASSTPS